MEMAWEYYSDKTIIDGKRYVSKEVLKKYLIENEELTVGTVKQYLKQSSGRLIKNLIDEGYIECHGDDGWLLVLNDTDNDAGN